MNSKLELQFDDLFIAGGNYDVINLINKGSTADDVLDGRDGFWLIKVRKGTPSHAAVDKLLGMVGAGPEVKLAERYGFSVKVSQPEVTIESCDADRPFIRSRFMRGDSPEPAASHPLVGNDRLFEMLEF